jgi:hypothetical protein
MFKPYAKQSDALEKFRIKAHLRSYVKDPIIIDEQLLLEAVTKLKKLPYGCKDPADTVAIELLLNAYRLGYFKYEDLTDSGCRLVRHSKHRRHRHLTNDRANQGRSLRNRYILKTI